MDTHGVGRTTLARDRISIIGAILCASVIIATVVLFFCFVPVLERLTSANHRKLAEYGETYIIWHALADSVACVFLGSAFLLQWFDLRKREKQFAEQLEAQRFQSIFLPYLTLFQTYVETLECGSLRGRRVLSAWREALERVEDRHRMERLMIDYGPALDHYHRHMEALLRIILLAHISSAEKLSYISLLQALLSEDEVVVFSSYRECKKGESIKNLLLALERLGLKVELLRSGSVSGTLGSSLVQEDLTSACFI